MTTVELWTTLVGLALVTLVTRASMLFLPVRLQPGPRVQRALRYAGPCVLIAIIGPDLIRHDGAIDFGFHNIRLMAALVATVTFLVTRSALMTILMGLVALTALRLFG